MLSAFDPGSQHSWQWGLPNHSPKPHSPTEASSLGHLVLISNFLPDSWHSCREGEQTIMSLLTASHTLVSLHVWHLTSTSPRAVITQAKWSGQMEQLFGKLSQWKTQQKDRKRKPYTEPCIKGERVHGFEAFLLSACWHRLHFPGNCSALPLVCPCREMIRS